MPTDITVSFSALTHTLTIVGDNQNNTLTVEGVATDGTKFTLSSTTDTFNHNPSPFDTIPVRNLPVDRAQGRP